MNSYYEQALALFVQAKLDTPLNANIERATAVLNSTLSSGGSVLIAGNGGSAAEAQHFSAELIGRYKRDRRGYPAIALTTDTSILTAIGNDYGFEKIFSRQIESLGKRGDVFIALSTSGNSSNLTEAMQAARAQSLTTIGLLGKGGGALAPECDIPIIVPSDDTARIQELHLFIIHAICENLDKKWIG